MLHDPDGKYRRCYSNTAPFSNMLFCGECGVPVHRRRLTSKRNGQSYKFTVWQCRVSAMKMEADYECHTKYIWEEVIERAYNEMLLKMTKEIDQIRMEGEAAIKEVSLSEEENARLEEVEEIIDRISDQITEMSMRESITNDPIYDATLRNLIYESQIYQQEHENLLKNKEESIFMKKNLDILIEYLQGMQDFETFDAKMFRETVERGLIYDDYQMEFIFKCGVKRKALGWRRGKDPVEPLNLDTL
jgi:ribosome-interacting GTPase 1